MRLINQEFRGGIRVASLPAKRFNFCKHVRAAALALPLLFLSPASVAYADLLLALTPSSLSANPGDVVTFMGQITNTTGVNLSATDMFLNFSGFDPNALTEITQLLGTPDFVTPNNQTSPVVGLFDVTIERAAHPGTYTLIVSLVDINNNLSNTETASITVNAVPEPSSFLFSITGVVGLILGTLINRDGKRRRRRTRPSDVICALGGCNDTSRQG